MSAIRGVEARYVDGLRAVARWYAGQYESAVKPFLARLADMPRRDSSEYEADTETRDDGELAHTIELVGYRVNAAIRSRVYVLSGSMAKGVADASDKVIGVRLSEITGARGIVTNAAAKAGLASDLERARNRNIELVENAHRAYAQDVREIISDPENFGLRVEELTAKLVERGSVAESRAELIARDQTLKFNGQLAQTRMMRAGVDKYEWSTSGDERVRDTHAALEGQVFSWAGPPDVGHPGQDFQCRCVAVPYLEEAAGLFDDGEGDFNPGIPANALDPIGS